MELGGAHISRRAASEEIFTWWREDVDDLRILGEKTFVLNVAGNYCNIAADHRPPIASDAKIHPAAKSKQSARADVGAQLRMRLPRFSTTRSFHGSLQGRDAQFYC